MKPYDLYFYPINIELCEEGGFYADCPLLQGCHAEGETYGETIDIMHDVIMAHIELRKKNNEMISSLQVKNRSDIHIQIPVPIEG